MTDRFDAQLRQHLLGTANERAADGQVAAIVEHVAVTGQRRPLLSWLPGFQLRTGRLATVVRYGLIAVVLALAAVAVAIFAGAGGRGPSTPFEGRWTTTDQPDGSTMNLYVGAGSSPTVRFEDLHATGDVCRNDEVKVFTADGVGEIAGERLEASFPNGGGCGLETVFIAGVYVYDPDADILRDQDGLIWTQVRGGDGPPPTLPPGPSPTPGPAFEGRWTATDPGDESTLTLIVGEGIAPTVQFQDDLATGAACAADEVKVFRADGVGEIDGSSLFVSYPDGGGCGLMLVPIAGGYDYDADTDTLLDQDEVTWTRVPEGPDPAPTLRPVPSRAPGQTPTPACIDLGRGGAYTAPAGPISVTATVPRKPVIRWQGLRDGFLLSSSCEDPAPFTFFALTETVVNDGGCMPSSAEITDFADAIARLDSPKGNDISERIDLTIDGHPAARYDISNLSTCPGFGLWHGTILGAGETGSIYVIDVDGVLLAIELNRDGTQTQEELEEAYAIIASLQIAR